MGHIMPDPEAMDETPPADAGLVTLQGSGGIGIVDPFASVQPYFAKQIQHLVQHWPPPESHRMDDLRGVISAQPS